ncbi:MAG TPA: methyltransferase domain-containing protein [Gaiellaceae bacterium]|nr:methyltransferase domain-containing protein [Gaiellaceae bacterium]
MPGRKRDGTDDLARDAAEAARRHFDEEAADYESGRRYRRLEEPRAAAAALLDPRPSDRLLDIGCGTGITVRSLASRVERAVGIDISTSMIEYAREQTRGVANVEFAVAESGELPFPEASFTAALCTFSFHHYPHPETSLREMARVLVGGGRLVLADASSDHWTVRLADIVARHREPGHVRFYRSHELMRLLGQAGFIDIAIHRNPRSWYVLATGTRAATDDA